MKRFSRGTAREALRHLADGAEGVVVHQHVARVRARAARARRPSLGRVERAHERGVRVRERPELEVVVRVGALLQCAEHASSGSGRSTIAQLERRHAADRHGRDHAERAERHARGAQQVAVADVRSLPSARTNSTRLDLRGEVREPRAGAVRAGGERARERLGVDVAEVRHRQSARVQLLRELVQADAGLDAHEARRGVGVEHAREQVEADQRALGGDAAAERVPRSGDAHGRRPFDDGLRELAARAGRHEARGRCSAGSPTN